VNTSNNWSTNIVTREGQYYWGDQGITIIDGINEETDIPPTTFIAGFSVMNEPQHFTNSVSLKDNDTLWNGNKLFIKGQKPDSAGYAQQHNFSWDSVSGPYNMPVNLHIPYNQNYLQLQFAQDNWGSKEPVTYAYILEGIDKNWTIAGDKAQTENYLNLPPGSYTFKARSKGTNGKWGLPATLSFTITPPWYQTWWAYTILVLLGVSLLRGYIVYRSRRLKKENRVLEEKVALRTSQLKQSLEDLKSTQSQLIQSEKMASLGELTAGIAHEIQNPLNFVNNFSELNTELIEEASQANEAGNPNEVKELLSTLKDNEEKINHHGKRADAIVKGMLQHSRASSGQKEPTDINALADEYLRLSYHGLRAKDKLFNVTTKTDFDTSIGKINIVPQDIGRVLLNLYNNAFYAVTERKKQHPENYEPTVSVATKKKDHTIELTVKDNGNGIPQTVIDKIFQPFFTTKPTGVGTGLGLSLSYDIIKAHGGEIKVNTIEGEFTEFVIQLPISK
jgi:signal transduction histidine kinase